ncbi:MAG: HU family DNA-binding protein [Odoribacteraceae bacterium]|jgi:predicted histone-like DNA-binding protein|nr:HU family DNA-binding protein [Odoribacteraceae bacterium]
MSIKYVLSQKRNPARPGDPLKWYAGARSTGKVTLKALGKEIAKRGPVSPADVLAVLEALPRVLMEHLSEGQIVRLGDFGSFQVAIGSSGVESEANFSPSLIETRKVVFRPGTGLKERLNGLEFEITSF